LKEGWQKLSFREASSCEARAREEGLPTGECGTHIEGNGHACVCVSVRGARQGKRHVFALRHWSLEAPQCQYEQLPGGLCVFRQHTVEGAEARPVRNLKERWGVGTEGCREYFIGVFGKAAKPFFYKRNFEVIIKCINRQLRIR
jgi:hypothetical protein